MEVTALNWPAVGLGTLAAFVLGMIWFSPVMFGRAWSTGSHDIQPPSSPPLAAMAVQLIGTFMLALTIGITETYQAIGAAIAAILACTLIVAGMDLFSQKTMKATAIDAGYLIVSGILMIMAQALL